jgi:hypothetical protein
VATHQPGAPADHRQSRTAAAGQITVFTEADQLRDAVFYYAGGELTAADLAWVATGADGLVMRASNAALVRRLRSEHGYDRPILLDPGCYAAKPEGQRSDDGRLFGHEDYWLDQQREHNVAAYLSPSPYAPAGDVKQLRQVLDAGREFCAAAQHGARPALAFTVVAADRRWLSDLAPTFTALLGRAETPIALILADRQDPLGTRASVEGLVGVLASHPHVALLRTDVAAFGALAHGAVTAAVGSIPSLRHLVTPGSAGYAPIRDATARVLVGPLLQYIAGSTLAEYKHDGGLLDCDCEACGGASLRRFEDEELTVEAHRHNVVTWRRIADVLFTHVPRRRPDAWAAMCRSALVMSERLEEQTNYPVDQPTSLRAWADMASAAVEPLDPS